MNKVIKKSWFTGGMKINQSMPPTLKPGEQLWGIYFTDREYARVMGDPLRAVVAAPAKIAAEEAATRLGLDAPGHIPSQPNKPNQSGSQQHGPRNHPVSPCNPPPPNYAPPSKF
jgi:hypothetical protein